jgi:beta-glucanase (GH16 family)
MMLRVTARGARLTALFAVATTALVALVPPAGAQAPNATACASVTTSVVGDVTWTPVFCDEFNGAEGSPDPSVWAYDLGNGGFGNREIETYCGPPGYAKNPSLCPSTFSPKTNTAYLDGQGHLVIQAYTDSGGRWLSARMKTEGLEDFQYGRIEASIRLPNTMDPGLWSAFWMLGSDMKSIGWPRCGEADVMEAWSPIVNAGPGPFGNESTIHTAATGDTGVQPNGIFTFPLGTRNDSGFHVYGLIWSANMMQFYVDAPEKPFYIVTASDVSRNDRWPFNAQFFLLLNVAVGGTLGDTPSSLTENPGRMLVDYVRKYTAAKVAAPELGNPAPIRVTAGAVIGNTSTLTVGGRGYVYFTCSTNAPQASCAIATSDKLNRHVVDAEAKETVTITASTTTNGLLPSASGPRIGNRPVRIAVAALALGALLFLIFRRTRSRILRYGLAASLALGGVWWANGGGMEAASGAYDGTQPGQYKILVNAFTESNTAGTPDASIEIPLTVK